MLAYFLFNLKTEELFLNLSVSLRKCDFFELKNKCTMREFDLVETGKILESLKNDILSWRPQPHAIERFEYEVAPVDPLLWLSHLKEEQKIYWSDRDRQTEIAGIGSLLAFKGWNSAALDADIQTMESFLQKDERLKFFGGVRFSSRKNGDSTWHAFPFFHFYLPVFELIRRKDRYFFACNLYHDSKQDIAERRAAYLRFLQHLFPGNGKAKPQIKQIARSDNPTEGEWIKTIRRALESLDGNPLEKVVLARKSELVFNHKVKAEWLLRQLRASNPNSFLFLFQPDEQNAFLGSTPERLFKRSGRCLETEAVAGTRRRGQTPEEDRKLKDDLLHCEKDLREHDYVVRSIGKVLKRHSRLIEKDKNVGILENARVQHLIVRFRAKLNPGVSDADVLYDLHPTPAVGGVPKKEAIRKIHQLEHFDRGWYAGPVGWISKNEAEFAVGIRSALLQGNKISLFAGAGIVRGSDPKSEWHELENKIANFIKILHDQ